MTAGTRPRVSIVLVTRNGAATLPALLDMVARQRVEAPPEIIAVDSGSTDGTVELLRDRADTFLSIRPEDFNHGLTRNAGIARAEGDLVVLMVQDAVPATEDWLSELIAPLVDDHRVAGAYARQQARDDASAIARHYLAHWAGASLSSRVSEVSGPSQLDALDPMGRLAACTFDNVCSCLRKSVWEQHPFAATPIAEDVEWARDVLVAGHRLVYTPRAVVVHSHDRPVRYEFDRTRVLHRRLHELFGVRTIPGVLPLARAIASSLRLHWSLEASARAARQPRSGLAHATALAVAWPLGQYLGALAAVRGWTPSRSGSV